MLLRQLSTPRPEELVVFEKVATDGDTDTSFSYPIYRDLRDRAAGFSHLVACDASMVALQSGDTTERVLRELVSGNYFQCLQTKAFLGAYSCLRTINNRALIRWRTDPRLLARALRR